MSQPCPGVSPSLFAFPGPCCAVASARGRTGVPELACARFSGPLSLLTLTRQSGSSSLIAFFLYLFACSAAAKGHRFQPGAYSQENRRMSLRFLCLSLCSVFFVAAARTFKIWSKRVSLSPQPKLSFKEEADDEAEAAKFVLSCQCISRRRRSSVVCVLWLCCSLVCGLCRLSCLAAWPPGCCAHAAIVSHPCRKKVKLTHIEYSEEELRAAGTHLAPYAPFLFCLPVPPWLLRLWILRFPFNGRCACGSFASLSMATDSFPRACVTGFPPSAMNFIGNPALFLISPTCVRVPSLM